jgi:hypothetical protein
MRRVAQNCLIYIGPPMYILVGFCVPGSCDYETTIRIRLHTSDILKTPIHLLFAC